MINYYLRKTEKRYEKMLIMKIMGEKAPKNVVACQYSISPSNLLDLKYCLKVDLP